METLRILALNPGSSSIKATLFGDLSAVKEWKQSVDADAFEGALKKVLSEAGEVDAVGCRVVDGGTELQDSCLVDEGVVKALEKAAAQAPLHSKESLEVVRVMRRDHPRLPLVAVFDSTFHQTLPPVASTYALPSDLVREHGIRRLGFHGLAYQSVVRQLGDKLPKRLLAAHLGSGSSACAILDGKSVDTTMGFTPLEGLVMGTRSGSLDPGLLIYLLKNGFTAMGLSRLLNEESGLKGVSGLSGDVQELEKSADPRARFALNLYCYSAAKHLAGLAVAMSGADALCFSGGIGEHSSFVREKVCGFLAFLGDVAVHVVNVDEELEIAREIGEVLGG